MSKALDLCVEWTTFIGTAGSQGGDGAHNNTHPTLALSKIIKL